MKTKVQKNQEVEEGKALAAEAGSIVFVDFAKTPVKDVTKLKASLRAAGSTYKVIKKRLLNIVFKDKDVPVDAKQFGGQVGTIFAKGDISGAAGVAFNFSRGLDKAAGFALVGGYDVASKTFFNAEDVKRIGQLPSREVLLAQLAGLMKAPLSQLANVLDQIAKKQS